VKRVQIEKGVWKETAEWDKEEFILYTSRPIHTNTENSGEEFSCGPLCCFIAVKLGNGVARAFLAPDDDVPEDSIILERGEWGVMTGESGDDGILLIGAFDH
jgi:hypothetical protein